MDRLAQHRANNAIFTVSALNNQNIHRAVLWLLDAVQSEE
jgi:hypothetical protein